MIRELWLFKVEPCDGIHFFFGSCLEDNLKGSNDLAGYLVHGAICLGSSGVAFVRAFCGAWSQYPSDPISMVYRLERISFTESLPIQFYFWHAFLALERLSYGRWFAQGELLCLPYKYNMRMGWGGQHVSRYGGYWMITMWCINLGCIGSYVSSLPHYRVQVVGT